MRIEHDQEADVLRSFLSDAPIVAKREMHVNGSLHVFHEDATGKIVMLEVHKASRMKERASKTKRETYSADPDADERLGQLQWTVTDARKSIRAQGLTSVQLRDFEVELLIDADGESQLFKTFRINEEFAIGLATPRWKSESGGFALKAAQIGAETFSWDWFDSTDGRLAVKRQEKGELEFSVAQIGSTFEVVHTRFLSCVPLRILPRSHECWEPLFRIDIAEGADLKWPTLINGKVVSP